MDDEWDWKSVAEGLCLMNCHPYPVQPYRLHARVGKGGGRGGGEGRNT